MLPQPNRTAQGCPTTWDLDIQVKHAVLAQEGYGVTALFSGQVQDINGGELRSQGEAGVTLECSSCE